MPWNQVTPSGRTVTYRVELPHGKPSDEYATRAAKRRHASYLGYETTDGSFAQSDLDRLTARKMGEDSDTVLVAVHGED